ISITHVATDDIIDSHEITNGFDISGTVDHVEAGQQVVITWKDHNGTTHTVTDANAITQVAAGQTAGTWNAHIPASELSAANLPDGFTPTFTATVVDVAGNSVQNTSTPTVDSHVDGVSLTLQAGSNSGITTDSITHGDSTGQLVFDLGSVNSDVNPAIDVVVKDSLGNKVDGSFASNNGHWTFTTTANKLTDGDHALHTEV
ncbi:Ig-like domain-containing protein, partial [Vibrio halioticoli]|uniref:Ig-like domain-containing protein n=1 Tax=Vibrio halioticoli TaxID=71388 RepID=UPI0013C30369